MENYLDLLNNKHVNVCVSIKIYPLCGGMSLAIMLFPEHKLPQVLMRYNSIQCKKKMIFFVSQILNTFGCLHFNVTNDVTYIVMLHDISAFQN